MWRISVQLDSAILAEHTVRSSYYARGGEMKTDTDERADTVSVQNGSFFASLTNRTLVYEIARAVFGGFHGVRYNSVDYFLAFDLGTGYLRLFFHPTTPYYIDIPDTAEYTPIIFAQGVSATEELFFIGSCSVDE